VKATEVGWVIIDQPTNFPPLFKMVTLKQAIKYKTSLGKAESLREFYQWYNNKWRTDYPMAYSNRWKRRRLMVTGRSKRRGRQYAKVKSRYRASGRAGSAFSRRNIGEPVGMATNKKHSTVADWQFLATRTLAPTPLTDIAKTTTNEINRRQRDIINLRGFKIHFDFDVTNGKDEFIYVNMAVLSPKDSLTVPTTEFYKAEGSSTTRYKSFNTTLSSMQMHYYSINTDRYTILLHKRWEVNRSSRGVGGPTWRAYKKYIKVNRQISYSSEAQDTCNDPIFIVIWCDQAGVTSGSPAVADVLTYSFLVESIYKEPKN